MSEKAFVAIELVIEVPNHSTPEGALQAARDFLYQLPKSPERPSVVEVGLASSITIVDDQVRWEEISDQPASEAQTHITIPKTYFLSSPCVPLKGDAQGI